ncbi:EVE domain-containing protein [Algoriphagus namhaensis]
MNYWIVKSEPSSYSWEDFVKAGEDVWDGVRNHQAKNFLNEMRKGDPVLFYHSGKDKAIVGLAKVSQEAYPDPGDSDWVAVDLQVDRPLKNPVTLQAIKAEDALSEMKILKQSRLSVSSLEKEEFDLLIRLSQ